MLRRVFARDSSLDTFGIVVLDSLLGCVNPKLEESDTGDLIRGFLGPDSKYWLIAFSQHPDPAGFEALTNFKRSWLDMLRVALKSVMEFSFNVEMAVEKRDPPENR